MSDDLTTLSSTALFQALLEANALPIQHRPLLNAQPLGRPLSWDRVEGMLLGIAIGDSLGAPTEGLSPHDRRSQHGEVRDYLPNWKAEGRRVGTPTDDSQLAFWTLEHMLEQGALNIEVLAQVFASRRIFGIGRTMQEWKWGVTRGERWAAAAPKSAGNGALMRIAPVVVPHVANATPALWHDAVLLARMTHNDTSSVASCVAFIELLWRALQFEQPPAPTWWSDSFLAVVDALDPGTEYQPRGGHFTAKGRFGELVRQRLDTARTKRWDAVTACNAFYSGAYLLETVPCVLWIMERHGHDPEQAIVRAVNDTHDNDTVAAIVGAAVGALHGAEALPRRWREGLTGRTMSDDDGRMQELIGRAEHQFWGLA
jgi:ADP-ribosylglycohydrolase